MESRQLSLFDGATLEEGKKPPESALEIAEYRFRLIDAIGTNMSFEPDRPKMEIIDEFLRHYNGGAIRQGIFAVLGHVSKSTFYGWMKDYLEGGKDALIPRYATGIPGISRAEKRCLIEILSDRVRIGTAILITKYFLKRKGVPSPSSPATLRRWAKRLLKDGKRT